MALGASDNLIVSITRSNGDKYQWGCDWGTSPPADTSPANHPLKKGLQPPLITIFHLLNEIMLISYIALCKKEIYKD